MIQMDPEAVTALCTASPTVHHFLATFDEISAPLAER